MNKYKLILSSNEKEHLLKFEVLAGKKIEQIDEIIFPLLRMPFSLAEKYFQALSILDKKNCFDQLENFYKNSSCVRRVFIDDFLKPIARISKQDLLKNVREFEQNLFNLNVPFSLIGTIWPINNYSLKSECKNIIFEKNEDEALNKLKIFLKSQNYDLELKDFKITELEYQSKIFDKIKI